MTWLAPVGIFLLPYIVFLTIKLLFFLGSFLLILTLLFVK
jgi:hypothetical protein